MMDLHPTRRHAAFTLIELLIVVAIIAILAAIAVPNFLEAQTRSKVSRVRSDMRSIATAMEAYYTDYNKYPLNYHNSPLFGAKGLMSDSPYWNPASGVLRASASFCFVQLTTPVAYMAQIIGTDPFRPDGIQPSSVAATRSNSLWFAAATNAGPLYWRTLENSMWCVQSQGPNQLEDWLPHPRAASRPYSHHFMPYDPTNGTVSTGDILRYGPGSDDGGYNR